jgi:hypothetical protein
MKTWGSLTVSSSVRGSTFESSSSGCSKFRKKCFRKVLYAAREPSSVRDHVGVSKLANNKNDYNFVNHEVRVQRQAKTSRQCCNNGPNTFQHTDRSPAIHGPSPLDTFTEALSSDKLVMSENRAVHRLL